MSCNVSLRKDLGYLKCDKAGCVCIPTDGHEIVYLCSDAEGNTVRCAEGTCIPLNTRGPCICVCRTQGIIKCDCKCTADEKCIKPPCFCFKTDKESILACEGLDNRIFSCKDDKCVAIATEGAACVCVCKDSSGGIKKCDDCSCERERDAKCELKCEEEGCVCLPSDGKACLLICTDDNGGIITCEGNEGKKCVCIETNGASCICVCKDDTGSFKKCDCKCTDVKS